MSKQGRHYLIHGGLRCEPRSQGLEQASHFAGSFARSSQPCRQVVPSTASQANISSHPTVQEFLCKFSAQQRNMDSLLYTAIPGCFRRIRLCMFRGGYLPQWTKYRSFGETACENTTQFWVFSCVPSVEVPSCLESFSAAAGHPQDDCIDVLRADVR